MNQRNSYLFVTLGLSLLAPNFLQAAPIYDRRCEGWGDSLDQGEGVKARYAWALKCETERHVVNDIKEAFINGIFDRAGTITKGYPTYGVFDENKNTYTNPLKWFAPPAAQPAEAKAGGACYRPKDYEVAYMCAAGCYTPEQMVLFSDGYQGVADGMSANKKGVKTLTAQSSFNSGSSQPSSLAFQNSEIASFITDIVDAHQTILEIKTVSGSEIRVTLNHPLVNEEGKVVAANTLKVGNSLVREDGQLDPIIEIKSGDYFGKVYNLSVASNDLKENIIVAQGFLNGSVRYQNEFVKDLNRDLLRSVVAKRILNLN